MLQKCKKNVKKMSNKCKRIVIVLEINICYTLYK